MYLRTVVLFFCLILMSESFGQVDSVARLAAFKKRYPFIRNILTECQYSGRWIYMRIDTSYGRYEYELVSPFQLIQIISDNYRYLSIITVIDLLCEDLSQFPTGFANRNRGPGKRELRGIKVNHEKVTELLKLPVDSVKQLYFEPDRCIKSFAVPMQYELIAWGFINNIKICTDDANVAFILIPSPYYINTP